MGVTVSSLIEDELNARPHIWANLPKLLNEAKRDKRYEGAYVGTYSLTLRDRSVTYVARNHNWCGKPVSASTIARASMKPALSVLRRKRIYWSKNERGFLETPQPLYAQPTKSTSYLVYVDIAACYYTLYMRFPLYLRWGGRFVGFGDEKWGDVLPPDLMGFKLVRNSIPGIWRAWNGSRIKEGKPQTVGTINPLLSPIHWGVLANILHYLASTAVLCGATYYNTDGAIFTSDSDAIAWIDIVRDLGLEPRIKAQGDGLVFGVGSYLIDGKRWGAKDRPARAYTNLQKCCPHVLTAYRQWC